MSTANRWLLGTLLALVAGYALVLSALQPTFDMAYFLPEPGSEPERVLVERLGQGAGARLIFIEIGTDAGMDATEHARLLGAQLADSPLFIRVEDGQREFAVDSIPTGIWSARFLLVDVDWSVAGLRAALTERLADLASLSGPEVSRLVARDPLWLAPTVLERLRLGGAASAPRWSAGPQRAFLLVETQSAPFDISGQQQASEAIRAASRAIGGATLELYGVGVYGARVQALIQRESAVLGIAATFSVLAIIALAYRSWRLTLLSVLPLASAVLGGLAVSGVVFGRIHGITVAFGATLVGVVDDYPMHLFSHARHVAPREGVRLLFRTLLASAGTVIVAYAALAVSGSRGLAQLGVFSLSGVICAMAMTCWVLPKLMRVAPAPPVDTTPQRFVLSPRLWLPLLAAALAALVALGGIRWNDDLGGLTPLPPELLARDHAMRQRFGAPDVRYLISIPADSEQAVLASTARLESLLGEARAQGLIGAWSSVTQLLPDHATQERRRAAIPAPEVLAQRLNEAGDDLPFRADAFAVFLAEAGAARVGASLSADTWQGEFTGDYVANHVARFGETWRSTIFVTGLNDPAALGTWLEARQPGAELVDLKAASQSLVGRYRVRLIGIMAAALAAIAVLVMVATRSASRFLWSIGTVAACVLFTLVCVQWLHGAVTLFHIVSLVLVAGLGVDYCLFYSRPGVSRTEFEDTRHAVIACAATTAGAFAILGASSIPLLSSIGSTVAIGVASLFIAARVGCRIVAEDSSPA